MGHTLSLTAWLAGAGAGTGASIDCLYPSTDSMGLSRSKSPTLSISKAGSVLPSASTSSEAGPLKALRCSASSLSDGGPATSPEPAPTPKPMSLSGLLSGPLSEGKSSDAVIPGVQALPMDSPRNGAVPRTTDALHCATATHKIPSRPCVRDCQNDAGGIRDYDCLIGRYFAFLGWLALASTWLPCLPRSALVLVLVLVEIVVDPTTRVVFGTIRAAAEANREPNSPLAGSASIQSRYRAHRW